MDTEDEARMKPGLETSREQVLADFQVSVLIILWKKKEFVNMYFFPSLQAFTGIDDIETSIEFLNGTNWNLMVRKSIIHL